MENKSNLAFKCNYCNGGENKKEWGFSGICSKDVIKYNIKVEKRSSCSHRDSLCRKFLEGGMDYDELLSMKSICYESRMLESWEACAGWDENNSIKPRTIRGTETGSIAVLTLRTPNSEEYERKIFAVFMIDEYEEGDGENYEGYVSCNSEYKLLFNRSESNHMKYWDFCENSDGSCRWGSGLFRYLDDKTAAQILKSACIVKKGTADEKSAKDFLEFYCRRHGIDINDIPNPNGANIKRKSGFIMI